MAQNSNLPSLDSLRPHLGIPAINTGLQRPLTTPSGIVTDDLEGLHAIADKQGRIVLQSGTEFSRHAYRGQPEEYEPCLPTLGRLKRPGEQLLALCRNTAFEDAIGEHPYVRLTAKSTFLGHPLHVDTQGLAQHYGLATDLVDFTSNFEVACFFATCLWDHEARGYRPVLESERLGMIYRIPPALFVGTQLDLFEIVGWQPLKRPEQQRALGLKMKKGMDLNTLPFVQVVKFRHCAKISTRIWESFDEGRALFPKNETATLAEEAQRLMKFTRQQVNRAWARLDAWHGKESTADHRQEAEKSCEIGITEVHILSWDGFDIERDERKLADQLRGVLDSVRYRRAFYPA